MMRQKNQLDLEKIKAERAKVQSLKEGMHCESIALILIVVQLVAAMIITALQSKQLSATKAMLFDFSQRLAVAVDGEDASHAMRVKNSDYVVETKDTTSFSRLFDLPSMPASVLQVSETVAWGSIVCP